MTRVLIVTGVAAVFVAASPRLPLDSGAAGVLQRLRALQTTASLLHTTAHPDDEHGGMLTMASRGQGVRVSLLTLTRGESGDNAIGPELFEALGLIRVEELATADRYYGVDRQYFTTAIDYGFSKRLDEALDKWGREDLLRDVVRVIRRDRPWVLVSRFQGSERDGHGNHQAAGLITQEAYGAAGDPSRFPEQIAEGLRPWQPLKLYMGGVRANEDWTLKLDTGGYDPVVGDSYSNIARLGLSFQRSQNGGSVVPQPGPSVSYYRRLQSRVQAPPRETSFFDGIDTTLHGVCGTLGVTPPAGGAAALLAIEEHLRRALDEFRMTDPSAAVPALARALAATRRARQQFERDVDVAFVLDVKHRQIEDAIVASLGLEFTARAQPAGAKPGAGPFAPPMTMTPIVPGQTFAVRTEITNRSTVAVRGVRVAIEGRGDWAIRGSSASTAAEPNLPIAETFTLTVPRDAAVTRPGVVRRSIRDARYAVLDDSLRDDGRMTAPLTAVASFTVEGVRVERRVPVTRREPNLPFGYETRVLTIVPAVAVALSPSHIVVPHAPAGAAFGVTAEVIANAAAADGSVRVDLPAGWAVDPPSRAFQFRSAGERASFTFAIRAPGIADREFRLAAIAASGGREFREGYDVLQHRDLETRYLYRDAVATVRGIDAAIAPGLSVGYVMGIGDELPAAIAQLGAHVELLDAEALAHADLRRFHALVTGTRAYGVRGDLRTYNRRLLDYAKDGGNLIVLYNTPEFVPADYAPFPGSLPADAEEVSEEDAPIEILAPADPVFTSPNRITIADFDGWIEQRGSKFWSSWDPAYTPMISTHDRGQAPQRGGWLHARYGKGHYTYFAYALHRQLPYGVPGAYRILANLLSLR